MAKSPPSRSVAVRLCAILLLPVLMSGAGTWEVLRGWAQVARVEEARVAASAAARPADEPAAHASALAQPAGRDRQASALGIGEGGVQAQLGTDLEVARVRLAAAALAFAAALASLGGSLGSVGLVRLAARRGALARPALVDAFDRVRRLLPFAMAVQAAGLALSLLGSVAFWLGALWFMSDVDENETKLAMASVAATGLALLGAFRVLRQLRQISHLFEPVPSPLFALPVTEHDAPGLFALLHGLVREQGAVMPDVVAVGTVDSFFVTSSPRVLTNGTVTQGRTLHLPLPVLAVLDRTELSTVLAHELAHFTGEDTGYSIRFQPVYFSLLRSVAAITPRRGGLDRLLHVHAELGAYVLQQFDAAVKRWSRQREFEADRAAVACGSADALATSLLRLGLVDGILRRRLHDFGGQPSTTPEDLAADLILRVNESGLGDPTQHLADRMPHPTDTHPPVRHRIEAVGVEIGPALLARASRPAAADEAAAAATLFRDWTDLNRQLSAAVRTAATRGKQQRHVALAEAARKAGDAEVVIFENRRRPFWGLLTAAVLFACLVACAALVLFDDRWSDPRTDAAMAVLGLGCLTALFGIIFGMGRLLLLGRAPYLVLTADGIRSPGFVGLVPWVALRSIQVVTTRSAVTSFNLRDEVELPRRTGRIMRLKVRRRQRAIQFMGMLPQGMKGSALRTLLLQQANAAVAKAELGKEDWNR